MSNPYYRSSRDTDYQSNPFNQNQNQNQKRGQDSRNGNGNNHNNNGGYLYQQYQYQPEVEEPDFGSAAEAFHHRQNSKSNQFNNYPNQQPDQRRQDSNHSYRPPMSGQPNTSYNPYQSNPNPNYNPEAGHAASYAYAPRIQHLNNQNQQGNQSLNPPSFSPYAAGGGGGDASSVSLSQLSDQELHLNSNSHPNNPYNTSAGGLQPPNPNFSNPNINRPASPFDGVYEDKAPKWEKLNPEQKKIAKQFPKDLDEEGTSLWGSMKSIVKNWRDFVKWKYTGYYVILLVILALVALMTIYHTQIIDWLTPVSKKIKSVSWGWVIPVAILFVVSFPPLFGAEVVIILCGVVYGLWIGFAIVSLGTLLGELGNFWAFMYCLKRTAEKYERKNLNYACMAHIVREGGFMVILLARLSAIPGHFTTAVFATVGMNVFVFLLAAILSMPKQLSIVYLGVAIEQSGSGGETTTSKIVKYVVLVISFIVTVWAAWYLYGKMEQARPIVQQRLRARRYTMLSEARKFEKASENTVSYEGEDGAKGYANGRESDEEDDGGKSMKMKVRSDHSEKVDLGRSPSGGWARWAGGGNSNNNGGIRSPRIEEEIREGQSILRKAAPIDRSSSHASSSSTLSLHEQQYDSESPDGGLQNRSKVSELDLEVLREATSPTKKGDNSRGMEGRPGPGNGLERNKSYRYATSIGSIYDYPTGSEDLRNGVQTSYANGNSAQVRDFNGDETLVSRHPQNGNFNPLLQKNPPPSYDSNDLQSTPTQQSNRNDQSSSRQVPFNQPHNAGWNHAEIDGNHHQQSSLDSQNHYDGPSAL